MIIASCEVGLVWLRFTLGESVTVEKVDIIVFDEKVVDDDAEVIGFVVSVGFVVVVGAVVGVVVVVVVVGLADVTASALSLTVSIRVTTGGVTTANRPHCCKNARRLDSGLSPSPASSIIARPSLMFCTYHTMGR
jgi:hypothetical protein